MIKYSHDIAAMFPQLVATIGFARLSLMSRTTAVVCSTTSMYEPTFVAYRCMAAVHSKAFKNAGSVRPNWNHATRVSPCLAFGGDITVKSYTPLALLTQGLGKLHHVQWLSKVVDLEF